MSPQAGEAVGSRPSPNLWIPWLVFGVLTTGVGIWLLFSREARWATLAILLAVALLLNGLSELAWAGSRTKPWVGYVVGGLYLLGGLVVIAQPGDSLEALAILFGIVLIATGVVQAAAALIERQSVEHWVWWFVLGVITVVGGVVAIVWPGIAVGILAVIIGIRVLLFGLVQIAASLALRSLTH
jgi:uncharacterized membrane protein HdeD (DUF308 family)